MLAALPTDGSYGSSAASAAPRSAALSGSSIASRSPLMRAMIACARDNRGREPTSSGGKAASQRCSVAPSQRRMRASSWRSISRAAQVASPAASAWPMASSANSWASCQVAAARCSSATRSGCSC